MRVFPFITVGKILEALREMGVPITRATFYRLEKRLNLPEARKTSGQLRWRVYTQEQMDDVVDRIKQEYNIE